METPPVQTPAMVRWVLLGVALWASVAGPAEVHCQSLRATVLSIGDGDTIRVRQAGRTLTVRLACIDAAETAQNIWGQQPPPLPGKLTRCCFSSSHRQRS